jgi:hypothetical protein
VNKFFAKIKDKVREIVIKKIVKSDGSEDAVIPTRGFILTIIFFCAFVAQLLLGLWSYYLSHVVWMADPRPGWMEMAHTLTKCALFTDLVALISGVLIYLSFPKRGTN